MARYSEARWAAWLLVDSFFVLLLVTLTINSLVADWSLNVVYDFFFLRVHGPIFYNVHVASILSVCFAGIYWVIRTRGKDAWVWVSVVFAGAAIHELALAFTDLALNNFKGFPTINVSWNYAVWLVGFLAIAIVKGESFQRRILFVQLAFLVYVYVFDIMMGVGSSVAGFDPTKDFMNPFTNVTEVLSWVISSSFWFLPKEKVERWQLR